MKNMRRIIAALLLGALVFGLWGCASKNGDTNTEPQPGQEEPGQGGEDAKTDTITMAYGKNGEVVKESGKETVDKVTGAFEGLEFKEADAETEMDLDSMLAVHFYKNDTLVASYFVDKNGTFRRDVDPKFYTLSSGAFDYEAIKEIYESSEKQ